MKKKIENITNEKDDTAVECTNIKQNKTTLQTTFCQHIWKFQWNGQIPSKHNLQ